MTKFAPRVRELIEQRYLRDEETIEDWLERVSFSIAADHREYKRFKDAIKNLYLIPSTPILTNAGTNMPSLHACFVVGLEDSTADIMAKAHMASEIFRYGGGLGLNISKVRPKGSVVRSNGAIASGPVSFLRIFDAVGEVINQRRRRAAMLAGLEATHPDIMEFIDIKNLAKNGGDEKLLRNFNLSVIIRDEFMNAVLANRAHESAIFDALCESIWTSGEPGLIFMDRAEEKNPITCLEPLLCSNACSELVLTNYESCTLSALNLANMVSGGDFDWGLVEDTTRTAVHYLDNVISKSTYPTREIESKTKELRRIGISVTGLHSALIDMGLQYNESSGLDKIYQVIKFINETARQESEELAKELGPFPAYDGSRMNFAPRRNVTCTCEAPTGCQRGDTLVVTNRGILNLNELVKVGGEQWPAIHDTTALTDDGYQTITSGFVNGLSKTKKITLKSGLELECTHNHKYRCIDFETMEYTWKRADEICVDDALAVMVGGYEKEDNAPLNCSNYNHFNGRAITCPAELTPELARWLGFYYANGSTHSKGIRLHFNPQKEEIISELVALSERLFGFVPTVRKEHTCISAYLNSKHLKDFLQINGLIKDKSYNIFIPEAVRRSSKESLQQFLAGLFLGDGHLEHGKMVLDTTSLRMAQDIVICQRALGINSSISSKSRDTSKGNRPLYRVSELRIGTNGFDDIEGKLNKCARNKMLRCKELNPNLFFDEVVSIEDSETFTLDLEVPNGNTYLANSIVSHNSTSIIAGGHRAISYGIEPFFSKHYYKDVLGGEIMSLPDWVNCALDMTPEDHIKALETVQMNVDSSVSKTINMPHETTVDDIRAAILRAYVGRIIKCLTLYRDDSRMEQIMKRSDCRSGSCSL